MKKIRLNDYNSISLNELHSLYYKKFKKIHSFLKKNNIEYFAVGGTLLGAIRHKGFIPWDNDMDIGMTRENFNKFISVAKQLENDGFKVVGYPYRDKVEHGLIKIGIKNTYCIEREIFDSYDKTFHIDVFPYDVVPNDKKAEKKHEHMANFYKRVLYYKARNHASNKFKTFLLRLIQILLLPIPSFKIATKLNKLASKFNRTLKSDIVLTNLMGAYSYEIEKLNFSYIGKITETNFGDSLICIPEHYDLFLRHVYGDNYMIPINVRNITTDYCAYVSKDFKNE